jgi:energy-coupling factor transport system ATP-binding protein
VKSRDVARSVILVALAVALGFVSIPVGITRVSPGQHMVNVLSAVMLGPWYALGIAAAAAIIRNVLGVGTLLAFPGGMIGALLAGLAFRAFKNVYAAGVGEIVGTGLLGSLASVWIVAPLLMGKGMALTALMVAFSLSTLTGSAIAIVALRFLRKGGIWQP